MSKQNKEEYKKQFCKRTRMTERYFDKNFILLPCMCEDEKCSGWLVVNNEPKSIKRHNSFLGNKGKIKNS